MKKVLWLLLMIILWLNGMATNYFVSFSMGNDANNGTSTLTPWKTTAKINSFSFANGDIVSFNRGDTWIGNLAVTRSGVTYNAYGTGANPVVTGFNTVTAWTNISGSIWESTSAISTLTTANMVTIGGNNLAMGRFPQSTYLVISAATSNTSLTSSSLNSAVTNWTGAQAVVKDSRFVITRGNITSASSGTINYTNISASGATATVGFGFFMQNDVRTLTYQNAWFYNSTTKKIRVFSASQPVNVKVASIDAIVSIASNITNITLTNIDFTGANTYGVVALSNNTNLSVQNCNILYCGQDGINTNISDFLNVQNNTVSNCNNNGIYAQAFESPTNTFRGKNPIISHNHIHNCGIYPGMFTLAAAPAGFRNAYGIRSEGNVSTIQYNVVDSCGYAGIYFDGNNSICSNNFVSTFAFIIDDVGGIYTFNGTHNYLNRKIYNNIVRKAIGTIAGTNSNFVIADGIYFDDRTNNINCYNNSIDSSGEYGIFYHNTNHTNAHNNNLFNNFTSGIGLQQDIDTAINNDTMRSNYVIASLASQQCFLYRNQVSNGWPIINFGRSDSNYWARPINDNLATNLTFVIHPQTGLTNQSLAQWVTFAASIPQDVHSKKSSIFVTNVNQFLYLFDSSQTAVTTSLPAGTWADITGTTYNTGSVTLQPFTSIVLMNTGSNIAPIANAGTSKNITLPTTSVSQTGSGSDPDGTIASVLWSFVSGPATGTVTPSNTGTTTLGGMSVAGTYVFQFKVTDNLGLTGVDTMSVVVNASAPPNLPPVVNAGGNKSIVQPVATVTQVGSAVDPDGTIAGVQWTKTSGPGTFNIVSPTSTTTIINGLTNLGVYQFTLTATDNLGLTGSQTITVTVNVPAPIPPVANAGSDQVLTWPTNFTTLNGNGTDADGTIVAYGWTRISGSGVITSPGSQNTNITGLALGVSVFQLTVTDNSGLQATDNVQITLNQGSASLSAFVTSKPYNGAPQTPDLLTNPPSLPTATTLNGVGGGQTNAASYAAISNITDPNYNSSPINYTFTITPKPGTITTSNLSQPYTGGSRTVSITTSDPFTTVTLYDGSLTPSVTAGNHTVITHDTDPNYNVKADTEILVISQAIPTGTWATPAPHTYPFALDGTVLNAIFSVAGIATYTPAAGFTPTPGNNNLVVNFVPNDSLNYAKINGLSVVLVINKGSLTIHVIDTIQSFDNSPKFVSAFTTATNVDTLTITYDDSHTSIGDHTGNVTLTSALYSATTVNFTLHILSNAHSIFITNYSNIVYTGSDILPTVTTSPPSLPYTITFNGSTTLNPRGVATYHTIATLNSPNSGADTVDMTIIQATPTATWPQIANGNFPFVVSSGNLNASSPIPINWTYDVNVGDTLSVGTHTITATGTPVDNVDYKTITITNTFTVGKGIASMSFQNLNFTYDGNPHSPLVVTVPPNLSGVVVTGAPQTAANTYAVGATLTNSNWSATAINSNFTISKSNNYTLQWATPSAIEQNSVITAAIDNATSTIAGTFTYNFPIGTQMSVPGTFILVAVFHPTNTNYNSQQITVALSVYGSTFLNWWLKKNGVKYENIPPF